MATSLKVVPESQLHKFYGGNSNSEERVASFENFDRALEIIYFRARLAGLMWQLLKVVQSSKRQQRVSLTTQLKFKRPQNEILRESCNLLRALTRR